MAGTIISIQTVGYLVLVYKGMVGLIISISKTQTPNITISNKRRQMHSHINKSSLF